MIKIILLITALLLTDIYAKTRPKIALVLSGGGARGGAHVGVIKALERKNIPIDMIIGTSMGSFVGALYASGKSTDYIENLLVSTEWTEFITIDFERPYISMRNKSIHYDYNTKINLGIDSQGDIILPSGVFKKEPMLFKFQAELGGAEHMKSFDNLSIPFRAISTDINTGKNVVMKNGSLAAAIYSSVSIPGGFEPISINGQTLFDGGISNNIPIDVAKKMGADIIIAVNVGEELSESYKADSYLSIFGQLLNILVVGNVEKSLKLLGKKDILITPDLKNISHLDIDKYAEIISRGEEAVDKIKSKKLNRLSLSEKSYSKYSKNKNKNKIKNKSIIDKIIVNNNTSMRDNYVISYADVEVGKPIDEKELADNLLSLYKFEKLSSAYYEFKTIDNKKVLILYIAQDFNNEGEINFQLGFRDDFAGHSGYSFKLGYNRYNFLPIATEFKLDLELGTNRRAYSEIYQPIPWLERFYFKFYGYAQDKLDLYPINNYIPDRNGNTEISKIKKEHGGGFGFHIGPFLNLEIGESKIASSSEIDALQVYQEHKYESTYASLRFDSLDNYNFPKDGLLLNVKHTDVVFTEMPIPEFINENVYTEYKRVEIDLKLPVSFSSHTFMFVCKYYDTYDGYAGQNLVESFELGGLFNMSGYAINYFSGDTSIMAMINYRYDLKEGGILGVFGTPMYLGATFEKGITYNFDLLDEDYKESYSVYFAADTAIGPFYLAYGFSNDKDNASQENVNHKMFYLYLGESF